MRTKIIYLAVAVLASGLASCTTSVTEQKPTVKIEAADTLPPASTENIYTLEEGELDSLTMWVLDNMKASYKSDPETQHIELTGLSITHVQGNNYLGKLTSDDKGKKMEEEVDIIYDGDIYEWQVK